MQALRNMHAPLIICALVLFAALAAMLVMDSPASVQMAAKRQISLQLRQDIQNCENLDGDDAVLCKRQAHGWAQMAKQELQSRRKRHAHAAQTP